MYQTHSQPKQQQYITLLDKCTQILRQDRIWLRNMLKSGHQQATTLFRGLPKNVDMKELQIKLRKFITRAKERQKQQQLQRFKQNMQLPDFVQVAAQKRQQQCFGSVQHQYQQQQQPAHQYQASRRPLNQNEHNHYYQERSSFAAKWNNYSHYNPTSSNQHLPIERSHFQGQQQQQMGNNNTASHHSQSRPLTSTTSTTKKEWQNNYKPHSFNKNLNYDVTNKMSFKNSSTAVLNNPSTTNKSRHNLSTSSLHKAASKDQHKNTTSNSRQLPTALSHNNNPNTTSSSSRRQMFSNQDHYEQRKATNNFGQGGRSSSKSLKQLQSKIYQELKQFQQNKNRRQSESSMGGKEYGRLGEVEKQGAMIVEKEKVSKKYSSRISRQPQHQQHPITPQSLSIPTPATVSKQSIDQILKFKLGNCDFQSYKRQQSSPAIDVSIITTHNHHQQPSFCNISQLSHVSQTKMPTSSQKKMYYNSDGMFPPIQEQTERDSESQRYLEEPLRFGGGLRQELEDRHKMVFASFAKGGGSVIANQLGLSKDYGHGEDVMLNSFNPQQLPSNRQHPSISITSAPQQLPYQKNISQSLYQSAQKQNDYTQNFIDSDLHKSIMQSIKKSRELYPLEQSIINNPTNTEPQPLIPSYQQPTQIASFPSSLYSSTNNNQPTGTLFTSPELLNQCRNFLKKTQQINFQNSGLSSNFNSSMKNTKFQSPTNSQQKRSFNFQVQNVNNNNNPKFQPTDTLMLMNFPQPITITQSITKDYYENYGQTYSQAKINSMFESKQSIVQKNIQFQTYSKPMDVVEKEEVEVGRGSEGDGDNYGGRVSDGSSLRKSEQPMAIGKSSSSQRHSQRQSTLTANNPPTIQFSHPSHHSHHSRTHSNINRHPYYIQSDQNYRTSQFKQLQADNRIIQHNNMSSSNDDGVVMMQQQQGELYEMIEIEEVIDRLLEANQGNVQRLYMVGNLEMDSTWLKHTIANHCVFQPHIGIHLAHLLHEFIIQPGQTHNFIDLLDVIYAHYRASSPNYRPRKSPASDICALLDIQQKGYIIQQDLQNFIAQLESAGVDNIEQICHHLQETFEMADFLSIKRIGFVNLYVIKNQDCFDALWGELQQFEFEVEGDHQ